MLKVAVTLALLLVSLPKPAICGWQYTRWGMTPEQVKSASQGNAIENPTVGSQSNDSGDALLMSPYRVGALDFKAYFLFDRKSKKLKTVSLELVDQRKGKELYTQLVGQYGRPVSQDNTALMRVARWLDRKNRNMVVWTTIGFVSAKVQFSDLSGPTGRAI